MVIYQHYKWWKYKFLYEWIREEDLVKVVIYESLEDSWKYPAGTIWVRPKNDFFMWADVGWKVVPRFDLMTEDSCVKSENLALLKENDR